MKIYKAEALDNAGKLVKCIIAAENEDVIINKFRELGYYPLKVVATKEVESAETPDSLSPALLPKEKEQEIFAEFKCLLDSVAIGDEDAYKKLIQKIARQDFKNFHVSETMAEFLKTLEAGLKAAGSARRFGEMIRENIAREEKLLQRLLDNDPEAMDEVSARWNKFFSVRFTDKDSRASGELVIIEGKLGFIQIEPEGRHFFLLCSLDEVVDISLKGFFMNKIRLTTYDGRSWNFLPDKSHTTLNKDRMMRILRYEIKQVKSDLSQMIMIAKQQQH